MTYILFSFMAVVPYLLIALGVVAAVLLIRYFINKHKHTERKSDE